MAEGWSLATGVVLLASELVALLDGVGRQRPPSPPAFAIGITMMLVGIWFRREAIQALGTRFADHGGITHGQKLERSGVYSRVRHPSELGLLLLAFGLPCSMESGRAIVVNALVLLPVTLYRLKREETALRAAFGQSWDEYARRIPALLPSLRWD